MKISDLIEQAGLPSGKITLNRPDMEIRDIALRCPEVPEEDILYILSEMPETVPKNLVLAGSPKSAAEYHYNFIQLNAGYKTDAFCTVCHELLLQERRRIDMHQQLVGSLMGCSTLSDILQKASKLMHCCFMVFDLSLRILNVSNPEFAGDPDWAAEGQMLPEEAAAFFGMHS